MCCSLKQNLFVLYIFLFNKDSKYLNVVGASREELASALYVNRIGGAESSVTVTFGKPEAGAGSVCVVTRRRIFMF